MWVGIEIKKSQSFPPTILYYAKSRVSVKAIPMNVTVTEAADRPGSAIVTLISSGVKLNLWHTEDAD